MVEKEAGRCVLTLPLITEPWQEQIIEKRFAIMEHLKNQLIAKELRKLKNLQRTQAFKELTAQLESTPKEARKPLYKTRQKMLQDAGFSEYDFMDDMTPMQKHFTEHIYSQIGHRAASDVWRAFDKYLYGTGREVHFHRRGSLDSVACKKAGNGMQYRDGVFQWSGGQCAHKIKLSISVAPPKTAYEEQMLKKPIQNMRILRKWMKCRWKYYLQLTLVGQAVQKPRQLQKGRVGLDIGTQTLALVSQGEVRLMELADKVNRNHKRKCLLQQALDRSRRSTNPEQFNADGTIRRYPKGERPRWVESRHYRLLSGKIRELERKNAAIRKQQHTELANHILSLGDEVYIETMHYAGLQRRAKETKINEKGRYQKKKRFGKSLANKAPAMLVSLLEQKLNQYGGTLYKVDTFQFRASQLDHFSGEYHKHLLSQRWIDLANGDRVQRDLYAAFLLMNSQNDLKQSDLRLCSESYPFFKALHDQEILRAAARNTGIASFGF